MMKERGGWEGWGEEANSWRRSTVGLGNVEIKDFIVVITFLLLVWSVKYSFLKELLMQSYINIINKALGRHFAVILLYPLLLLIISPIISLKGFNRNTKNLP